jgi:apolipoprotein N-acyltransferase
MKFFKAIAKPFTVFNPDRSALYAFVLGAASVLGFAPFNISPAMLATLMGLFFLWQKAETSFEAMRIGLWFGLGMFGLGTSWLFSSMYFYSGMNIVSSALATFIFVLFLSLYLLVAGLIVSKLKQSNPDRKWVDLAIMMPLVWVLMEWVRGSWFTGFPFLLAGNTHLGTWLDGYAPVFGVLGVSWAIATSAGLFVLLLKSRLWLPISAAFACIWLLGAGLKQITWVHPEGKPIKVALVQGNIPQDKKWLASEFMTSMKTYVSLTKQSMDADVIVWPETAIPAYFDLVQEGVLNSFIRDAKLLEKDILLGVIARTDDHEKYYNALVNARNPQEFYYKKHLVPFSEYFPFSNFFKALSLLFNIPFSEFSEGEVVNKPMKLGGQMAGVTICYEIAFGDEMAKTVAKTRYLITVSNDAWFAHTFEPAQQVQDVQMRALELGREIARSTNTGYTMIVGVDGQIKAKIPAYKAGVLKGDVQPYVGETFFAKWKLLPIQILMAIGLVFVLGARLYKSRKKAAESTE